ALTGTNFCNDGRADITFNGVVHNNASLNPTSTPSTTLATTTIAASEIATPGTVQVTITNNGCGGGTSAPRSFVINPPLTLSPDFVPSGAVGSPYNQTLTAGGGTPPYGTPVLSGRSVPPNTTSPGSANISFTPAANAFYNFQADLTDSGGGSISVPYAFSVNTPSQINPTAGTPQSTTVNTNFTTQLQVRVTYLFTGGVTASQQPLEGAQITFSAPASGASGTFLTPNVVFTDGGGFASVTFRANTVAGSYNVLASVTGAALSTSFSLTNLAGAATSIVVGSGTPQSTTVGSAFSSQLRAIVRDAFSNPKAGTNVTFAGPASGAGAIFSPASTVATDSLGQAIVTASANTVAGSYTVGATTAGVGSTANFSLTNTAGNPVSIAPTAGTPQSTPINTQFPIALRARVTDSYGNAVPGVTVTFSPPAATSGAGPSGTFPTNPATGLTDAAGVAIAPAFTANNVVGGPYNVTASFPTLDTPPAAFALTNTVGVPASITTTAGSPQSATVNTAFATALKATVRDASGNPVPNVSVTFTAPASGASGAFGGSATVTTDSGGVATAPTFTANSVAGTYNVNASTAGVASPAAFALTNTPGPPAAILTTAGSPQTTTVNTAFPTALKATVRDANSNPVPGVSVTFAAPASGASGTFGGSPTVTTDSSGVATAPTFTANGTAGSYTVTATTQGVAGAAAFNLTNGAGAPASITSTTGTPQSATINTAFPTIMTATVRDANSNLVPGVSVVFTAPGAGASGTFGGSATVTTNASGVATAPAFTANSIAGSYAVAATTAGVAAPALFNLTNNPGAPFSITATGGSGQSTVVSSPFQSPLQATVRDVGNNPVPNASVTFAAPTSGASASVAATVSTNASGVATSPIPVANDIEGSYNATATVTGVATPAQFSLVNTGGLAITTTQLPGGIVGLPYNATVGATGGRGGYTFSIGSGSLPPGLTFSSSGSITGIPQVLGSTPVQITVRDSGGGSASRTFTIRILGQLTITTSGVPSAFVGRPYSVTFSATGGEPPYSWSVFGGAASPKEHSATSGLPPGLSFDSITGTLSGTPTGTGDFSFGIQVRDTAQRIASRAFSITSSPASSAPAVKVSKTVLDFQAPTGGDNPPPQYVSVVAANLEPLPAIIEIDSGATGTPAPPWLSARFVTATTPARLAIFTNQAGLPAGKYKGRVLVKYGTIQTLVVDVEFTVDETPPQLSTSPTFLRFVGVSGVTGFLEQELLVRNIGTGGPIDFTAKVITNSPWLSVSPDSGRTSPNGTPLRVIVNSQGFRIGSALAKIQLESALGGKVTVPVSMFQSPNGPIISLDTEGVRFDAREGNGLRNTREITVLNTGTGTVNWTAEVQTGGTGWVSLSPTSGQATPNSPGRFVVTADPRLQKAGPQYALIRISDPQALNSPKYLVVVLNVQGGGVPPEPDLSPGGLYFTAVSGGPNPLPQTITVHGGLDVPTPFQSAASSDDGAAWLSIDKTNGSTSTGAPGVITAAINSINLKPGVYTGDISVSFSNETIRTANVTLVVLPAGAVLSSTSAVEKQRSASGCAPSRLAITSTSLVNAFASPAGWPTPLSVRVTDDCGSAVANAQVVATFSNGDPPLLLNLSNPGAAQYSGTWAPGRTANQMTVTVNGAAQGLSNTTARLTGSIGGNNAPALIPNGVVNTASGEAGGALAPGTLVQIAGGSLSPITTQPGLIPLPTTFNNTSVLVGAFSAPVFFLSDGQVSAQIPSELQVDRQYSILVNSNGAFTLPDTITVTAASPGLLGRAQHADLSEITAESPARPGETVSLYLVGMGVTTPPVASGAGSPPPPPDVTVNVQPVVTIGGITANVRFAGLSPGLVGLYQVNVDIPEGVTAGDVPIIVTQNEYESNTITIPVR
ncbi:MAG TPA: Ig-like domain-containing protein, partial [Bryobacteraceae bacterium]|nr:Ig-like domain-containing protein [Bryobacteraceae bacterium]